MVEALPFQALMYDLEAFSDLSALICPPYDVISDEMREDLYRRDSFNIVRLEYAKEASSGENKYDRAARDLRNWMGQGVLKTTERPSFYLLNQNYSLGPVYRRGNFDLSLFPATFQYNVYGTCGHI